MPPERQLGWERGAPSTGHSAVHTGAVTGGLPREVDNAGVVREDEVRPGWNPPTIERLEAWQILRGVRWHRSLSQRELAELSGMPQSTISRIEAGRIQPRFDTLNKIVNSCGYTVFVARVDGRCDPVLSDPVGETLRDRALRRVPAHLPVWLIGGMFSPWWGWSRIGWTTKDATVPKHSYGQRPRHDYGAAGRWLDAT